MGFFDKVKDVLTTSDAQRARKTHDPQDGTTSGETGTTPGTAPEATPQVGADQPEDAPAAEIQERPAPAVHRTHTVQRGDTLAAIAEQHGADPHEIARLNHLDNPDLIYPGQVLRLPGA